MKNGGLYRNDVDFILFDVCIEDHYIPREYVENIAQSFNLDVVPIVLEGTLEDGINYVKTHRQSTIAKNGALLEGVVGRPKVELLNRGGARTIVKIKYCDFKE